MPSVGNRIQEVRKMLGYNQSVFAKELGMSQTHVSGIENGRDNPSTALIKLICMKFNIDETWLSEGLGTPTPNWDVRTDEGAISKYNAMRVLFEKKLQRRTGEDLVNTVEAFAYFDSVISPRKLSEQDESKYLSLVCAAMDDFEKLIFKVSSDVLLPSKKDVKAWLTMRNECEAKLKVIAEHMKESVNLYLAAYGDEMKL